MVDDKTRGAAQGAPPPRRSAIAVFTSHWLAMLGLGLVLTAIVMWFCLLPAHLRHGEENPYVGIATAAIGGVLLLGAVLAPIGLFLGLLAIAYVASLVTYQVGTALGF